MIKYPEKLFFVIGIITLLLSFLVFNQTLDIHIHDTYFIIDHRTLYRSLAFLAFFYGLLYKWTKTILFSPFLTWAHFILTIIAVFLIIIESSRNVYTQRSYGNDMWQNTEQWRTSQMRISTITFTLIAVQLTYFTNLVGGLIKKLSNWGNK
ncbi:MAG: hypothetical protein ABIN89_30675 [Chitinophagaceae bacterium]